MHPPAAPLTRRRACCLQVRRILDVIRGRDYEEALMILEFMPQRCCEHVRAPIQPSVAPHAHTLMPLRCSKPYPSAPLALLPCSRALAAALPTRVAGPQIQDLVLSCASNAKNNLGMKKSSLYISEIFADQARARTRSHAATQPRLVCVC